MQRRHFLQSATATLATLGLSHFDIQQRGDRYGRAIAQTTARKLALLVGINAYPESSNLSPLQGCLTDVELQRQLLIHRFGFKRQDILTLTDAQATRQGMLTAFEEHLIKQAKPGDIVVFHFSGHGSQVIDPDRDATDGLNSTFVPVDSVLPLEYPARGGAVKDIMGHTLFLLMAALRTENVTVVLDSCHSGGGTRGVLRVRSRAGGAGISASPEEFAYQQQWLSRLNLSAADYRTQRRRGVAKGVVIASAKRDQLAADAPFSEFHAGAFTYLMTQYLWQQTGQALVTNTIPNVARNTTKVSSSNQEPVFEVKPGSTHAQQPIFFTEKISIPAEAVITKVSGNIAEVWLGGLAPQDLVAFEQNALLAAVDATGKNLGQVVLQTRTGLVGQGKLVQAGITPGGLLQEQMRGIPSNLPLLLGLDPSLGRDLAVAQRLLTQMPRVEPRSLTEGEVHYILARLTPQYQAQLPGLASVKLPPVGSLGLFSPGLEPIPGAFGLANEAIAPALERLRPKLRALLAARLVKLTLNANAARLQVGVSMTVMGSQQIIAQEFTLRGSGPSPLTRQLSPVAAIPRIPVNQSVQIQIQNQERRELYFSVLVINSTGEMTVLFPNQWTADAATTRVAAGSTLQIPNPATDTFKLVTQPPTGATEVLIIASSIPFGRALKALQAIASRGGQTRGPVGLAEPIEVVGDLLADLSQTRSVDGARGSSATRFVDTTQTAALALTFEVVG